MTKKFVRTFKKYLQTKPKAKGGVYHSDPPPILLLNEIGLNPYLSGK